MDGRTRYNKVSQVLKPIVGKTLPLHKLQRRVMIDVGSSESIVRECITLMLELGLIKEVKDRVYKILTCEASI